MTARSGAHAARRRARRRESGSTWGGWRPGAGRKPKGEFAGVSHAKRASMNAWFPVLVTLRLRAGLRSLRADDAHALLGAAFAAASSAGFRVVEYSLQRDHLHLVAEARDERALARGMTGLGVRVARGLNRLWRRAGRVFQDRYDSRVLRAPREVRAALVRVLQDARKHGAWAARRPDPYSSGPAFDGWSEKAAGSSDRMLARARTRLLASAWRRLGRLDPLELPAGTAAGRRAGRSSRRTS